MTMTSLLYALSGREKGRQPQSLWDKADQGEDHNQGMESTLSTTRVLALGRGCRKQARILVKLPSTAR